MGHGAQIVVATGHQDRTVRLWQTLAEPQPKQTTLSGHAGPVYGCSVSSDGHLIASASHDRTVRVWSPEGRCLAVCLGPNAAARACCFHPTQPALVAAAYHDGTIVVWRAREGRRLVTLKSDRVGIRCLAYDLAGRLLAATADDGSVTLWDTSGDSLRLVSAHEEAHRAGSLTCAFSPLGAGPDLQLLSGGRDGQIRCWGGVGPEEWRCLGTTMTNHRAIYAIAWASDGSNCVSAGEDGSVQLWELMKNVHEGTEIHLKRTASLHGSGAALRACLFVSPDVVASAGHDGTVQLWRPTAEPVRRQKVVAPRPHSPVSLSPSSSPLTPRIHPRLATTSGHLASPKDLSRKLASPRPSPRRCLDEAENAGSPLTKKAKTLKNAVRPARLSLLMASSASPSSHRSPLEPLNKAARTLARLDASH